MKFITQTHAKSHYLNLGILAHVDAGKTSLTERLLYAAGVIDQVGSVDGGTTQTDTLALERQRGITIRSAVASFVIDQASGLTVNLIDTPGHPDFIAEVERALSVLDGAVLVVSGVEGVQPQTRILARTLERLRIPTIIFINKMDRPNADYERTLQSVTDKLPSGSDYPVFSGSAITGDGMDRLIEGIATLLPKATGQPDGPVSGRVFKIERDRTGSKIAFVRMFTGTIRTRDRLLYGQSKASKVTAIRLFKDGGLVQYTSAQAGQIVQLRGLTEVQIGDTIGESHDSYPKPMDHHFAPPALETAIVTRRPAHSGRLHTALSQLAEQDPLINLRQDDIRQELYVSLYGEVQKEVIQATLADDFGIEVEFRATTTTCVERPLGSGAAVETGKQGDAYLGTVGLRIDPAPAGSGVSFRYAQEVLGTMPAAFFTAVEETVYETLRQGIYGWQVTDCTVTMTDSGFWPRQSHAHASFDKSMSSTAGDFRAMTPLALMAALRQAGTVVCEPIQRLYLDIPTDALPQVLPVLAHLRGVPQDTQVRGMSCTIEGRIPAARVHELQQQLPALSSGEGVLETNFDSYQPVSGQFPARPRTGCNPLDRRDYLLSIQRRV